MSRKARGARRRLQAHVLAGASVLAIGIAINVAATATLTPMLAAPAAAQDQDRVYRQEALAHARAISEAWRRLEDHILRRSTAAVRWTGSVPPAGTGWLDAWTERGVRARYCENTLLVYMEPDVLKGVGRDQRSVQVAPHLYAGGDGAAQLAALHWLESGTAAGAAGRPSVTLPACLSGASFGGPLPGGRAALAGRVQDPHLERRERISHERTVEDCPEGTHGGGRTMTREVRQAHDGRADLVGDPVVGTWQVSIDDCRADYSEWEHYTLECSWTAGAPHNRKMTGQEIWRRERTVTAKGVSWGEPEFVSTSCWEGKTPALPKARITETFRTESARGACPAGYTGAVTLTRTVTKRSTTWPWDAQPTVQDIPGNWISDASGCIRVVTPDPQTPDEDPEFPDEKPDPETPEEEPDRKVPKTKAETPDEKTVPEPRKEKPEPRKREVTPGGPGGTGAPGSGTCGPANGTPGTGSTGPGDGTCSGPGVGPGAGNGGGGCFLTEAVVGARSIEADDGPTLTVLRAFRDGYMQETPERRALVARYYEVAPRIVAAVPHGHGDWAWIGAQVDEAVAEIAAGEDRRAFNVYVAMVRRLEARWLAPAPGAAT